MALTRITKGVIKPNENYDTHNINSTGIVTAVGANFTGNVSVGGVLTYEDVSSIDAVGIITANQGIHVGAGVSAVGVGTFGSLDISGDIDVDGHTNLDNVNVVGTTSLTQSDQTLLALRVVGNTQFEGGGNSGDVTFKGAGNYNLSWDKSGNNLDFDDGVSARFGSNNRLHISAQNALSRFRLAGNVPLTISKDTTEDIAKFIPNGAVELYHNNIKRLETSSVGVSIPQDLDVDGHTNLDNVSVAGVTTFAGSITAPDVITAGALLHEGDTDTLVHFSAANTIQLKTGGTSKLLVNNFGISLENGDLNTNGNRIIVGDSSGSSDDRLVLGNNNDLQLYHNASDSYIENATGVLKILGDDIQLGEGNDTVGIGTDNAGAKLDVLGSFQVKNASGYQNFFVSESGFKYNQSPPNWSNMTYTSSPVLGWDYKSGPGDMFYVGSGGNTAMASQMALVVSDGHGVKIGKSGYDGTDYDISSSDEYLRITTTGLIGIGTATIRNNRTVQITGASQSNLLITGNAPSICLNADADDSTDNDRTFLGQAIGSNNFANGTAAGDTVLRGNSSGRIVFGIGTNVKMNLTSAGDLNIGSVGRFDANGLVKTAHGTESAPSHTFLNDPDNGMYRPTTNTLGFVTGGAEKLRIKNDGKVGIGTDDPWSILTAYGENRTDTGSATGQITAKDNAAWNANPTGGIIFQGHMHSNGANAVFGGITGFKENGTEGDYAGALAFHTRVNGSVAQERLRIASDGKVKIGNSGGTPDGKLHIDEIGNGDIVAELTSGSPMFTYRNGSNAWFHAGKHPSDDAFVITQGGTTTTTELLRITSAGRMKLSNSEGIQLSAKTSSLYATDGTLSYYSTTNGVYLNGAGANGWLRLNAAGSANDRTSINLNGHSLNGGDSIHFRTDSSERVRITSAGNVTVGNAVNAGNTLRYFDVANYNTGGYAGSIIRLLTTKSDGSSSTGLDIVKYKTGGAYIINNENVGADTGFIAFNTGSSGISPATHMRIAGNGEVVISPRNGGASNNRTSIHFNNAAHTPFIAFKSNNVTEAAYIKAGESSGGCDLEFQTKNTSGTLLSRLTLKNGGEIFTHQLAGGQKGYPLIMGTGTVANNTNMSGHFNYHDVMGCHNTTANNYSIGGWVALGNDYGPAPYPARRFKIFAPNGFTNGTIVYQVWHDGDSNYYYGGLYEIRINCWTDGDIESVTIRLVNGYREDLRVFAYNDSNGIMIQPSSIWGRVFIRRAGWDDNGRNPGSSHCAVANNGALAIYNSQGTDDGTFPTSGSPAEIYCFDGQSGSAGATHTGGYYIENGSYFDA